MANESGDLKLLANFRKLIDLVSADNQYKPREGSIEYQLRKHFAALPPHTAERLAFPRSRLKTIVEATPRAQA